MGTFRIGSGGSIPQTVVSGDKVEIEIPTVKEVPVERLVQIPVVKEVSVEVQKPVFKIVEVDEKIQKPKIVVEEVPQVVIKPVFTIKQETIMLDQLQKKLDESLKLAHEKVEKLNQVTAERAETDLRTLETLKSEAKSMKIVLGVCVVLGVISAIASILG